MQYFFRKISRSHSSAGKIKVEHVEISASASPKSQARLAAMLTFRPGSKRFLGPSERVHEPAVEKWMTLDDTFCRRNLHFLSFPGFR
jgi:hypothetical protein